MYITSWHNWIFKYDFLNGTKLMVSYEIDGMSKRSSNYALMKTERHLYHMFIDLQPFDCTNVYHMKTEPCCVKDRNDLTLTL